MSGRDPLARVPEKTAHASLAGAAPPRAPLGSPGRSLHVGQGEFQVAAERDVMLTTILGSCVAACLWNEIGRAHV